MVVSNDQANLKKMLSDAIPLLCKSSLGLFNSSFSVEAIVGITINDSDVTLISFKETVLPDGSTVSHSWHQVADVARNGSCSDISNDSVSDDVACVDDVKVTRTDIDFRGEEVSESTSARMTGKNSDSDEQFSKNWKHEAGEPQGFMYPSNLSFCESANQLPVVPLDWEARGCQDDAEDFDCTLVKIEKEELEVEELNNDLTDVKSPPRSNVGMRRTISNYGNGRRRHPVLGHRMSQRASFVPNRLHAARRQQMSRSTNVSEASSSSQMNRWNQESASPNHWSNETSMMETGLSDSYRGVMDKLCRNAVQQSTVTAEKQYICHICHARLSSPNNLMAHIQGTHLALDRYQCNLCQEKFRWYMQLHRHRKRFHSDTFPPSCI